ncbi:hypothetical protein B566_EDAN010516 [Ephemera danica]|nr:hypothetical protein B566_EDAN010516 [Ephemera danica]
MCIMILLQNKLNSEPELGVEHLSDLSYPDADPPCHFCCKQTSTAIHDENRLKIVSRGNTSYSNTNHTCLVRSRDGGREGGGTHYMNLPSPNVQTEENQEDVFKPNVHRPSSSYDDDDFSRRESCVTPPPIIGRRRRTEELDLEEVASTPPSSVLARRRALVPPKLMADNNDGVNSRKNKNTWSLLKLFDRSNRVKSESLCGLEEVLSCIQRSEFKDEQLSKYRGMSWSEFVVYVDTERDGKCNNGISGAKSSSSSSSSSNNHSSSCSPERPSSPVQPNSIVATAVVEATPQPTLAPVAESSKVKPLPERPSGFERRLRIGLMRTQSEKSFERRLTSSMWRGMDKPLPERILPRPAPLIPTLSEKDLLGSKEALASPVFMEPLKTVQVDGFAMFAEPELLFGNLDELCCVTYAFCKEFINLILQNVGVGGEMNSTEILVKLFQKSSKADSVSQAYHCYALNYINALNYLETLRRHMEFCEFEKWCNRDPRCKKLQLTDLLVAPVQHIMKVPLILKEVENRTEEAEERDIIGRILEMEENSLRELDDKMKWLKNFERLLEIQRNIVWPSVFELDPKMYVPEFLKPALARQPCERIIVSPRRQIIMEGPLNLWDSGKPTEMYVVLFDDMLLISRRKKGLSKKKSSLTENWTSSCSRGSGGSGNEAAIRYVVYKQPLSLDRFFIHDVTVPEGSTCRLDAAFVLVSLNRFQQIVAVHTFQAASDQLKQNWLLKLRDTQDKWKRTLQHTVFRSPRVSTCSSRKSTT